MDETLYLSTDNTVQQLLHENRYVKNQTSLRSLIYRVKKNQLDAQNIFLVYFVNLYMFRAYLGPFNPTRTTDTHLKRLIITNCCIHTVIEAS